MVLKALQSADETIAVAESCTGGWLGRDITSVSGASASFWLRQRGEGESARRAAGDPYRIRGGVRADGKGDGGRSGEALGSDLGSGDHRTCRPYRGYTRQARGHGMYGGCGAGLAMPHVSIVWRPGEDP